MPEIVFTMLSVLSVKEYHLKTKHYVGLMSISHSARIPVTLLSQQLDFIESQLYRLFQKNIIKIANRVNVRELTCDQNCCFIFIGKSFISSKHMVS